MKNSLEIACERFFLKILRADSRLSGKTLVHFDQEAKAKRNAIIVQAKEGNNNLSAFGGADVELIIEYRAPAKTTAAANDIVTRAIHEAVYENRATNAVLKNILKRAGLSHLLIRDEATSDRQNSSDLRKRTMTFPLQAKLA